MWIPPASHMQNTDLRNVNRSYPRKWSIAHIWFSLFSCTFRNGTCTF